MPLTSFKTVAALTPGCFSALTSCPAWRPVACRPCCTDWLVRLIKVSAEGAISLVNKALAPAKKPMPCAAAALACRAGPGVAD